MGKVRIRHGENEIEVEGTDKFIEKHLTAFYERVHVRPTGSAPTTLKKEIQTSVSQKSTSKIPTPAEYYRKKNRTDGVSQVLIFGKYLEDYRSKPEFSRADINELAKEARISKNIHSQFITNAVKQGLLRSLGSGKYSLTLSAEDALAAMK